MINDDNNTLNVDELDNSLIEREIRMGTQIAIVNASIKCRTVHTGVANNGALKVSKEGMSGILIVGNPIRIIRISIAFINK